MKNRKEKTQYLFDSIGEIDDKLLEEALEYMPARKKQYNLGLIAACLAVFVAVALVFPLLRGGFLVMESDKTEEITLEVKQTYDSLDELMTDIRYTGNYMSLESADEISFTDGACIVWRYGEEDGYFVKPLDDRQLERLNVDLGSGYQVGVSSPALSCQVWIVDDDGIVRSPYLKDAAGNQDCTVFDYEAEIVPTRSFVVCVSELLT